MTRGSRGPLCLAPRSTQTSRKAWTACSHSPSLWAIHRIARALVFGSPLGQRLGCGACLTRPGGKRQDSSIRASATVQHVENRLPQFLLKVLQWRQWPEWLGFEGC